MKIFLNSTHQELSKYIYRFPIISEIFINCPMFFID